ncbi:MAG TPA: MarR family transcriptional regulator [Sphingobium sp.]|uniref:MarR family winged helix-turn-helix transcriptional regulator n=1 Tax=Sphingobium sp. TaxID=1912891 RepID=UPI002ED09B1A
MERRNIGSMVGDVSRLMRRAFDERARSIGVTRPQWVVLSVLSHHEGINQGGLADMLEVEPITLCRMIDRLQDAELIERRRHPSDRRAWCLHLTEKAHGQLAELRPLADEMMETAMEGISDAEQVALWNTLETIRQNLSRRTMQAAVSHG